MTPFLTTLRAGGPAFAVSDAPDGFTITAVAGRESGFNDIARLCMETAGPTFAAFPRSDGRGGFDQVLIVPIGQDARGA